jgi:Cytochrome c554 and c-prime
MRRILTTSSIVLLVGGLFAVTVSAAPTYVGVQKCKMCHRLQFESWSTTKHAKATEDAKNSKTRKFETACLTCHATNHDETMAGVQCEACHGPGSGYKTISIMKDVAKAKAAGLIIPTQTTCNGCHDGKDHHKKIAFTKAVHAHKAK